MAKGTKKKKKELTIEEKLEQALVPKEEWPYELPKNWCWVKIHGITSKIKRGKAPKYVSESEVLVFAQKCNQKDGTIAMEKAKFLDPEKCSRLSEEDYLKDKDIIINSTGTGTLGRVGFYRTVYSHPYQLVLPDSHITVVRPLPTIVPDYLYYFLKEKQTYLELQGAGTTNQKELRPESIGNINISLPPIEEQQRIVNRIESLFAKLDEAKDKARTVLDGFEDRKTAILHKAFTGELTVGWRKKQGRTITEWQIKKVADIGEIITGSTPSTKHPEYYNGTIPFVKPTELNQGRGVVTTAETLTEQGKAVSRPIRAGSTCICCIGATISKCGMVSVDCVTNQQINSIVPYDYMDDVYVYYYCCSSKFKNELIANSSATTLPIINKSKTSNLQFVVPPREEQHQIAVILDILFEKEQQAKEAAGQIIEQIDIMKKSILARAFLGELGTNDPANESAEELLKRIL